MIPGLRGALSRQPFRVVTASDPMAVNFEFTSLSGAELPIEFDLTAPAGQYSIVSVTGLVRTELVRHFHRHPEELKVIDRRKFEELVAELFDGFGYEVELTQQTRDGGKDVIAVKRREVEVRYLIECKRPDPGKAVGVEPVRALLGVLHDEGATKGILATTAHFSPDAQLLMSRHLWRLEGRDYAGLMDWLGMYLQAKGS